MLGENLGWTFIASISVVFSCCGNRRYAEQLWASLIQLFDGGLAENCNLFAFLVLLFSCIILYFFSCYGFFFLEINKELVQVERTFAGLYDAPGVRNKFNIHYSREVARCGISAPIKDEMNPQYYSYIKYEFCENLMIFCFYPYVK